MNVVCLIFTKDKIWDRMQTLSNIVRKPGRNSLFHQKGAAIFTQAKQ